MTIPTGVMYALHTLHLRRPLPPEGESAPVPGLPDGSSGQYTAHPVYPDGASPEEAPLYWMLEGSVQLPTGEALQFRGTTLTGVSIIRDGQAGPIPLPHLAQPIPDGMREVRLVNLTPHAVTVVSEDRQHLFTLPPSGTVARCQVTREQADTLALFSGTEVAARIPIYHTVLGTVEGLPDPIPGVYYVVSRPVAEARRDRRDLLIPDDTVRDDQGRIIGCRGFATLAR